MSFATPNQKVLSLTGTSPIFTDTERDESDRLIFVKRIPGIITAEEFATIALDYAQKGPIIDIKYRRHTGGDKTAFALIYFQEEEDGREAIKGMNGKHIEYKGQHRVLSAERASRWTQQVSRTNLYVTHLPHHWTGSDLKSVFDKFGRVLQATVLPHPEIDEQNSGAGFVRFSTEEEAALALKSTHKKPATPGSEQILEVKYAKANLSGKKNRTAKKRKGDFLNVNPAKKIRFNAHGLGQVLYQPQMQQAFQQVVTAANGQQFICVPRVMPQRMAVAQQQMFRLPSGQIVQSPQAMQYAQLAQQQQQAQMMAQPQMQALQQAQMIQQMQAQSQLQQYAAVPQAQQMMMQQQAYQRAQLQQMMLQQQAAQAQAQAAQATAQQVSDTATVTGAEQVNAAASDNSYQAQAAAQMQQNARRTTRNSFRGTRG